MPTAVTIIIAAVLMLSASIWLGGYVTIALVARTTSRSLEGPARVAFFRGLGRTFLPVGATVMILSYVCGIVLLIDRGWDGIATTLVILALALMLVLAIAVRQARQLTKLRARVHAGEAETGESDPAGEAQIKSKAMAAGSLRGMLGLISIVMMVLGVVAAF